MKPYQNFQVAAYVYAYYLKDADDATIQKGIDFYRQYIDLRKVYVENHRGTVDIPVERLLPAHRAETGDLRARAEELRLHHLRRLENALDIVRRRPGLTAYDIAGEMRWSIRCRNWGDFPVTQKFFAVGEALSHLDYLEVRGLVERRTEREHDVYFAADGGRITQETYFK